MATSKKPAAKTGARKASFKEASDTKPTLKNVAGQRAAAKKAEPGKKPAKKPAGKGSFTCTTCGKETTSARHLCDPGMDRLFVCEFCGAESEDPRHICAPKLGALEWYCEACGRVSADSDLLCVPRSIE